ncbi:MFS transporter [Herbiconiux sp. YIM B11900]|uniref:MFS transporter n=1 Tax=Herbiconiux sp. YIM B11900 TaxID=3404131 RepID=UPI003F854228
MTPPEASAPSSGPAPLWRGRALALIAIVVVALNLRLAVVALSPILGQVSADIALGSLGVGVLGMLPPVCFAVVGLFAPALHRRFGLEPVVIGALAAILIGHLARALSGSYLTLVLGSAVTFAGMGVANVLLPALVKRYFPDRVGLLTALYATTLAISATIPPLLAVPIADAAGWRASVGSWSVFAVLALLPMVLLAAQGARDARGRRADAAAAPAAEREAPRAPAPAPGRVWRSPLAWGLAGMFAMSALNVYAMFAWLPSILAGLAGVSAATAGILLSVYSVVGLVPSLLVPLLAGRLKSVRGLALTGSALFLVGYGGLLLAPQPLVLLWVVLAGLGPLLFPLVLVLINLRTRTPRGAVVLSSFAQSFGYAFGALGPLLIGILHDATGSWTAPVVMLLVTGVVAGVCGLLVAGPRMLEDQWHN